jgi:hypothetical protein
MNHQTLLLALNCILIAPNALAAEEPNFTKVCASGEIAGTGNCPLDPAPGIRPNEWACTKDNTTQLIWSIHTVANQTWTQAIDQSDDSPAGKYNGATRCGFHTQWRLPTRSELGSIAARLGHPQAVDPAYFPEAVYNWQWSSDPHPTHPSRAWIGFFYNGLAVPREKTRPLHVRLVHSVMPR